MNTAVLPPLLAPLNTKRLSRSFATSITICGRDVCTGGRLLKRGDGHRQPANGDERAKRDAPFSYETSGEEYTLDEPECTRGNHHP